MTRAGPGVWCCQVPPGATDVYKVPSRVAQGPAQLFLGALAIQPLFSSGLIPRLKVVLSMASASAILAWVVPPAQGEELQKTEPRDLQPSCLEGGVGAAPSDATSYHVGTPISLARQIVFQSSRKLCSPRPDVLGIKPSRIASTPEAKDRQKAGVWTRICKVLPKVTRSQHGVTYASEKLARKRGDWASARGPLDSAEAECAAADYFEGQ